MSLNITDLYDAGSYAGLAVTQRRNTDPLAWRGNVAPPERHSRFLTDGSILAPWAEVRKVRKDTRKRLENFRDHDPVNGLTRRIVQESKIQEVWDGNRSRGTAVELFRAETPDGQAVVVAGVDGKTVATFDLHKVAFAARLTHATHLEVDPKKPASGAARLLRWNDELYTHEVVGLVMPFSDMSRSKPRPVAVVLPAEEVAS